MSSPTGLPGKAPRQTTRLIGRRCTHGNVFSRPVLIGRGLDLLLALAIGFRGSPGTRTLTDLSIGSPGPTRGPGRPDRETPFRWPWRRGNTRSHSEPGS